MGAMQTSVVNFTAEETAHARLVASIIAPIIPGLARVFGPRTEVLLHDLTRFPNTIVAIEGGITGRAVGGPPTDLGVQTLYSDATDDLIGYRTELPSGRTLKSSSVMFRAPSTGRTVAALCMNTDVEDIMRAQELLASLSLPLVPTDAGATENVPRETFPESVDVLAQSILVDAIRSQKIEVELMKKSHKLEVVRELDGRGFFALRESVDLAAKGLGVTRYTIYNYLNALPGQDAGSPD